MRPPKKTVISRPGPDKRHHPAARAADAIAVVPRGQWNALVHADDPPFIRHEFLELLEASGCVGPGTGWTPCHTVIVNEDGALAAASPAYLKDHSWGEYVFDWAWARAYREHGIAYYPKLVCAIPFTPVTTHKLLVAPGDDDLKVVLVDRLRELAAERGASSVHALFLDKTEAECFASAGYLARHDSQFHWFNEDYRDFDDFLARFTSKRRKNVRAERRKVREAGVTFRWISGDGGSERDWLEMYDLYRETIGDHGGMPYLTREFFLGLPNAMGDDVLLLKGLVDGNTLCAALYFRSRRTLYGRYWGSRHFLANLHFETCYYQPIEYAIAHGLASFEAGAQGTHKLARGLAPTTTRSAHWLDHPAFHEAVERYLGVERREQAAWSRLLEQALPFRSDRGDPPDR